MSEPKILIIDLGSQTTEVIARVLREGGYRTAMLDPAKASVWLRKNSVEAIILSGGDQSVNVEGAIQPPEDIFCTRTPSSRPAPILAVCYGHQWLAKKAKGRVASEPGLAEYGETGITITSDSPLFHNLPVQQTVWASHGDTVVSLPDGFKQLAVSTRTGGIAAMSSRFYYGVQFHPEQPETQFGRKMLMNFMRIADCKQDWEPSDILATIGRNIAHEVGEANVAIAYSGGVDSSVAAAIAVEVLPGKQVHGITIDADNLREGEVEEIRKHAAHIGLPLEVEDMRFSVACFAGTVDAQKKRRIFRELIYTPALKAKIDRSLATYALQGTLAPDMIESGERGGALIKTHHNTGLDLGVVNLHPLAHLFKHEVRELARLLGLPESISQRKPFPGPGNILRVVGVPVTHENLAAVRWAYAQVERIIKEFDPPLWDRISQLVIAYLGGSQITGVRGDARAYEGIAAIRAVETVDYMTARGIYLPEAVARPIMSILITRPPFIRVMFDPSDKAPATIEYE